MKYLIIFIILIIWTINFSFSEEDFPYWKDYDETKWKELLIWNKTAIDKIKNTYLPDLKDEENPMSYYISIIINYFLGMLAFFTFLVILWWASLTFTWKTDEWIKKWMQYMKIWIIVIIVIWVSWLISMFIFSIYNSWIK